MGTHLFGSPCISINLIFNQCIFTALIRKEMKIRSQEQYRSENKKKLRSEKVGCSVGVIVHTTIHVINCFSEKWLKS